MPKHVEVECGKLSARQCRKLAKGAKCVVKKGQGTKIVVAEGKGKHIEKQFAKGKGAMLSLDDEEKKMNGEGFSLAQVGRKAARTARMVGREAAVAAETAAKAVDDVVLEGAAQRNIRKYKKDPTATVKRNVKKLGRDAKKAALTLGPAAAGAATLYATGDPSLAGQVFSTSQGVADMFDKRGRIQPERVQRGLMNYAQSEFDANVGAEEKEQLMFYRDLVNTARKGDDQGFIKKAQQKPSYRYMGPAGEFQTYAAGQGMKGMLGNGLYAGSGLYAGMGHGHLARNKTKAQAEGKGLYAGMKNGRGMVGGLHQPLPTNHQALQSQNDSANRFMQFQIDRRLL